MAVKITSDGIVKIAAPEGFQFNLDELNSHVDGWIEPLKIGPVWVMYREKSKESGEPLNQVASFFFDVPMYGTVLVVPPQQMPTEWEIMEPSDYKWSSEQIDTGFLTALKNSLLQYKIMNEVLRGMGEEVDKKNPFKEEWAFRPTDEIDDDLKEFFRKSYDSIVAQEKPADDTLLFEDDNIIVRTLNKEDRHKAIEQMIQYFVEEEEYEKCAKLKKLIETH
jgi:hypothetical protein